MRSTPVSTRRTAAVRKGGRSERVVAAILNATLTELGAVGFAPLRLEDIATRAGVAKTTLYRRWSTKHDLVEAAVAACVSIEELPDTGALRTDLLALLESGMRRVSTSDGRAIVRLLTTEGDAELRAITRKIRERARNDREKIVKRAKVRGEIPAATDAFLVTEPVFSFVLSRLIKFGERTDRVTCTRLIDIAVTGAQHGGGRLPTKRGPR